MGPGGQGDKVRSVAGNIESGEGDAGFKVQYIACGWSTSERLMVNMADRRMLKGPCFTRDI